MANENVNIVIKAVDKTKKSFRAVTVGLNAIKKAVFSMQTALIALGVAGFGFLVKKSLDATDALGKMADKIGIGTAQLGGLRYAAELTGVATNVLDMGLQRMVRRVSEAAAGTGAAKNALIELGLSAEALNDLSPDEQFRAIADAMEGVAGQGEKVRLAMSLFDTEGVALVNTLKGGSAALKAMEQEAERLGLRLSGNLVKGVEKANDAMTKLGNYVTNVFHRAVAELSPLIETITNSLMAWFQLKVDKAGGPALLAIQISESVLLASEQILTSFRDVLEGSYNFANGVIKLFNKLTKALGGEEQIELIAFNADGIDSAIFKIGNLVDHLGESKKAAQAAKDALNSIKIGDTTVSAASGTVGTIPAIEGTKEASLDLGKFDPALFETETEAIIRAQQERQLEIALMVETGDIGEVRAASLRIQAKNTEQDALTELVKKGEYDRKTIEKMSATARNKIAMDSGKEAMSTLGKQYKWAFDLNKTFAIKDALINTFNAVAKALNNPFPMNIGLGAMALAGGMAQVQAIRSTSFREKGGPISSGNPYIVGERGPELIVPSQAANVIPNDQLGGNNVTINVTTNDANGFDDLLTRSRGTLLGLMNQALNENGRPALV